MAFVEERRSQGHAVESICRVLREQGCQVAARTYRERKRADRQVADRTITDARVVDAVRDLAWTTDLEGRRKLAPEGLYGRRKMTALVRRRMPGCSPGSVDRAMRTLGLSGVRRAQGIRNTIPAKDGKRASDPLDRDFTAIAPNRTMVMDFSYVRTWAGFVYVAFVADVYAQRIVAWHAATTKHTDLVMIPLRMALWQRDREGRPAVHGRLIAALRCRVARRIQLVVATPHDHGGVQWYDDSSMRTGLFDLRCGRLAGPSPPDMSSASSGA